MTPAEVSVLVVDDVDDVAGMLAVLINAEPDLLCVGRLASADTLIDTLERVRPNVVIYDLTMPGRPPLDAMKEATTRFPECRFLVLSGYDADETMLERTMARGAWGYVPKHADVSLIVEAVRTIASGLPCFRQG